MKNLYFCLTPAFATMAAVPTRAIVLFLESWFSSTTRVIMLIARRGQLLPCYRIMILCAELLSTCPAPCATTTRSLYKSMTDIQSTRKNISTCIIFETPSLAPWTLFSISRSTFRHILLKSIESLERIIPLLVGPPKSLAVVPPHSLVSIHKDCV